MGSLAFESIKLVGFKSFVEPTDFQIEPGLTGVVGPNGCGKSNLLEAIRWVMGANSAKAMRASGMDDVIFSGTKTRPGRGQASVTLTIDNKARIAPSMFNDDEVLEVSRIITKGSGSKYKVNGKTVRAKDVQLLFADASTGANSPALVRQGQINELISAKPANRRRILEEAAGISGLHTRRHEAELRLRAAENNLDRLEDILQQIESQLLSLRRQSRQAARYKQIAGEIREYKSLLWLKRWQLALETLSETTEAQSQIEAEVVELTSKVTALTENVAEIATKLEPQREEQIVSAAICGRLNAAKEALDNDEKAAKTEIGKLEARLDFLTGDIARENAIVEDAKAAQEKLDEELQSLSATEDPAEALESAKTIADKTRRAREDLAERFNVLNRKIAEHDAIKSGLMRTVEDGESRLAKLKRQRIDNDDRLTAVEADAKSADSASLFGAAATAAISALQDAKDAEAKAGSLKSELEVQESEKRDIYNTARQNLGEIKAKQSALSAVLADPMGEQHWIPVLDQMTVEKGYELALTAALGDDLSAGLDDNMPVSWHGADTPDISLPGGVSTLSDYVTAPDKLHARLSQIGVTDAGQSLQNLLKPGQRLVSKAGDLWRWDGFSKSAEAKSASAIRLENANKLSELEAEIPPLEKATTSAESVWKTAQETLQAAAQKVRDLRAVFPALEREDRQAQNALSQYQTEQARKSEQKTSLQARATQLSAEYKEAETRLNKAKAEIESLNDIAGLERELNTVRADLEAAREAADEASGEYRSLKSASEARISRLSAVKQDIEDWTGRAEKARARVTSLEGRRLETETALQNAKETPDAFNKRQQQILTELSEAESRASAARDALASVEAMLRTKDGELRAVEHKLATARETRAAAQARKIAAEERKQEVIARIQETLSCGPDALKDQLDELDPNSGLSEHDIERKLERLSKEREKLGGVNLRADAEAIEQEERLSALTGEREDLLAAIARLREAIDSLNSEGREKLLAAFDVVNGHFGRLFTTLFGGGQASLALTESEDPLEAGLDVLVSPPGKKLGSMSLMSGGEQALTATALIFAVFLSNPAPICVLDEVDAPLDDANVERYCNLLDEMTKQTDTKFIAITHNPVTMARMDRIFGVTMAEKGVSQLVSIALTEARKLTA